MEQEQPLSNSRMLIWSLIVVAGVLLLAAFPLPVPEKMAGNQGKPEHRASLKQQTLGAIACESGSHINVRISFSNAHPNLPGFSCSEYIPAKTPLLKQLTNTSKPLVISFEP
ncbi:hypothetical protein GZ77_19215 [Endozoicomonas montiporae]|uniref:Uncharacterized protein n=2 Tax=Endozoicomonas montiporae TaxID=1027273 RepID=A0A081N2F8_9GAMM|nr:hypothetical protein [Endozoicomonas montiporae]AMO58403.1 hypothetical protein EZMO1_4488 [Endozoicomonas montiporae CL-33]KEQ12631.1 hypothetical protein GZ77_19215 [Endozoicomonas montiporae]